MKSALPLPVPLPLVLAAVLLLGARPAHALDPASVAPVTSLVPTTVTTAFDPGRDGFPFANRGDYAAPGGNCWGMSLLAIDAYLSRRSGGRLAHQADPAAPLAPITWSVEDSDLIDQATASLAQAEAWKLDRSLGSHENQRDPLSDTEPLRAALERISRTGEPEILVMDTGVNGPSHAAVLFGYSKGELHLYDPDFPGETIAWPYDPGHGVGAHPKAARFPDFYGALRRVSSTPFRQFRVSGEIGLLRKACSEQKDVCVARFQTVEATVESPPGGKTAFVVGRVFGGMATNEAGEKTEKATRVWVVAKGKPIAFGAVASDGTFRVPAPVAALARADSLELVAATDRGALAGFGERKLGAPSGRGLVGALEPR